MSPVEIAEAVTELAGQPFDQSEFPWAFLLAFGNKEGVIARLRKGSANKSDIGGVLQPNNVHIKTCAIGAVPATLTELRESQATAKFKAKFIIATDGDTFEAEDLNSGETVACPFATFDDHFGFFLPLAGISTVKQIRENAFDIKATGRLNKLYLQLLKDNPDWAKAERRTDMNHFMARLIFCFFAEDTDIFNGDSLFTATIEQMGGREGRDTELVIGQIFLAMNTKLADRAKADSPGWADVFPYVNGGLFSGSLEVPGFSKIARSYLLHIGRLDWTKINPDIFGSMIQAVADDEERGALGMHYTSVPNILKVLNPLFLDDLRAKLDEAGDNARKLLNLRSRMARIRVFDPACGSGNFLVIAYKEMRAIEAEINKRRGEPERRTEIPLTNFRGIELRDFPAEIARLALIIAEYQCDVLYRGQKEALAEFLPLDSRNWIVQGNALRLDWLSVCEPTGKGGGKIFADDLYGAPLDQAKIDFENAGGETYICGNPPYLGSTWQNDEQKYDLERLLAHRTKNWKSLDYVAGWFIKAADYGLHTPTIAAFVTTNSICQGRQVEGLWNPIFELGYEISFAHTSFRWKNLASHNAGVTVAIVAITNIPIREKILFSISEDGETVSKQVDHINAYLVAAPHIIVSGLFKTFDGRPDFISGNVADDDGALFASAMSEFEKVPPEARHMIRRFLGSSELINGKQRYCLWVEDEDLELARTVPEFADRFEMVRKKRESPKSGPRAKASSHEPHKFAFRSNREERALVIPRVSSENRPYLPVDLVDHSVILGDRNFALYDADLWNMALIASRIHWVWIGTVCVRMRTDFSYSNTLGWNTFPLPKLTEQNKADLTRCAENILLAREAHFPATIADLYDPEDMPADLRRAHEENDEVLERIYIGRRFRNDTERLEKLFELYTQMTAKGGKSGKA